MKAFICALTNLIHKDKHFYTELRTLTGG